MSIASELQLLLCLSVWEPAAKLGVYIAITSGSG